MDGHWGLEWPLRVDRGRRIGGLLARLRQGWRRRRCFCPWSLYHRRYERHVVSLPLLLLFLLFRRGVFLFVWLECQWREWMNAGVILRRKTSNECLFGTWMRVPSFIQCGISPRGMGMARSGEGKKNARNEGGRGERRRWGIDSGSNGKKKEEKGKAKSEKWKVKKGPRE